MPKKKKDDAYHPMRQRGGKFPHEMSEAAFLTYLIKEGMLEEDYQENMERGAAFARDMQTYGKPLTTAKLSDDQRGWAKNDHPTHFHGDRPRWFINPAKLSRPLPASTGFIRNRLYNDECVCEEPEMRLWSTRHDGVMLLQCENCGEVIEPYVESEDPIIEAA